MIRAFIALVLLMLTPTAEAGPLFDRAVAEGFPIVGAPYVADAIGYGGLGQSNAVVLDIRPAPAYDDGHIPTAVNAPTEAALSLFMRETPETAEVIVGCGEESGKVLDTARTLRSAGYDRVKIFFRGPVWRAAHYLAIDAGRARELAMREDTVFVDVRISPGSPGIEGSIPINDLAAAPDDTVVVFCEDSACTSAERVAHRLVLAGHRRVRVLAGGLAAWDASFE